MSSRYRLLVLVASLIGATLFSGCFTLLRHPRLSHLDYQRPDDNQCVNCHSSQEIWAFNHSAKSPTYVGYSGKWSDYYDVPWWYKRAWDFEPDVKTKPTGSGDDDKEKNHR